jgi:hypothetical protein
MRGFWMVRIVDGGYAWREGQKRTTTKVVVRFRDALAGASHLLGAPLCSPSPLPPPRMKNLPLERGGVHVGGSPWLGVGVSVSVCRCCCRHRRRRRVVVAASLLLRRCHCSWWGLRSLSRRFYGRGGVRDVSRGQIGGEWGKRTTVFIVVRFETHLSGLPFLGSPLVFLSLPNPLPNPFVERYYAAHIALERGGPDAAGSEL